MPVQGDLPTDNSLSRGALLSRMGNKPAGAKSAGVGKAAPLLRALQLCRLCCVGGSSRGFTQQPLRAG